MKKSILYILMGIVFSVIIAGGSYIIYSERQKSNPSSYNVQVKNVEKGLKDVEKKKYLDRIEQAKTVTGVTDNAKKIENLHEIGFSYQQLGDYRQAMHTYKQVLALNINDEVALNNVATLLTDDGKYERANKAYLQLMKRYPDSAEILEKIIDNHIQLDNKPEAVRILDNFAVRYSTKVGYKTFILSQRKKLEVIK